MQTFSHCSLERIVWRGFSNFWFLGMLLKDDLSWSINTRAIAKKAQQRQPPLLETAGVLLPTFLGEHPHLLWLLQQIERCRCSPEYHQLPHPVFTETGQVLLPEEGLGHTEGHTQPGYSRWFRTLKTSVNRLRNGF